MGHYTSEIAGTWTQGQSFELRFHRGSAPAQGAKAAAAPSDLDGDWLGILDTGMGKLRLLLHIANTQEGLSATLDSLDQNAKGLPVTSVTRNGSSFGFEIKTIGSAYRGTISSIAELDGTWDQLSKSLPLVFKRVRSASAVERPPPQMPVKPYPYCDEEVAYKNVAAKPRACGHTGHPFRYGAFPAVLLLAGSGPQDRDETIYGHKPFLVLADYLTRNGMVVLRADKRGMGSSGGSYRSAVMEDFVSDADAGVAYLRSRPELIPTISD